MKIHLKVTYKEKLVREGEITQEQAGSQQGCDLRQSPTNVDISVILQGCWLVS